MSEEQGDSVGAKVPGFDPAVEHVEWSAQRDLGGVVPVEEPLGLAEVEEGVLGDGPRGRWVRYLRDTHAPRFDPPGELEVGLVHRGDGSPFAAIVNLPTGNAGERASVPADLAARPGWRCHVARREGEVVGAGATFTEGEIGLLAVVVTIPPDGGDHVRSAILHRMITDSIEAGCWLLAARAARSHDGEQARPGSSAALLLAGFEEAYPCPVWVDSALPAD
jgi:hypothetical protein